MSVTKLKMVQRKEEGESWREGRRGREGQGGRAEEGSGRLCSWAYSPGEKYAALQTKSFTQNPDSM